MSINGSAEVQSNLRYAALRPDIIHGLFVVADNDIHDKTPEGAAVMTVITALGIIASIANMSHTHTHTHRPTRARQSVTQR